MTPAQGAAGRLLVCPTPIGNLQDVTLRVLDALRDADVVACEDTRHTAVLLARHSISAQLLSLHEHNERARAGELVARIRDGAVVALVSDAGTPLVSDPGFALVRECIAAGVAVEVLPGPSAVTSALVASGLPAERWLFVGFLPRKRAELARLLRETAETLVAFESPRRLAATLALLAELDAQRPAAVCRELTKLHEEVRRGSAAELAAHYAQGTVRGEIVLVVGAAPLGAASLEDALAALRELVTAGARPRPAAGVVAGLTGLAANELYRELTRGGDADGSSGRDVDRSSGGEDGAEDGGQ
jgi:16S rRNA (cytidine1402-2'-O)-methyltransferase